MTPEDKECARICLERGWLTIEQVEEIRGIVEARGTAFRDVGVSRGLIPGPPESSGRSIFSWVIDAALGVFVIGCAIVFVAEAVTTRASEVRNARMRAEWERVGPPESPPGISLAAEIEAERRLRDARDALRYVEGGGRAIPKDERDAKLDEALAGLDAYLGGHPASAAARCDRARARELLGQLSDALADYEEAMKLEPQLAKAIEPRAAELRKLLGAKKP